MNEQQLQSFIYSCKRAATRFHFNNEDGIKYFIENGSLDCQTFDAVIAKNIRLIESLHSGVCFTMSAWVMGLLSSIGASEYYFMESFNNSCNNSVVLYKVEGGYRICDLAALSEKNRDNLESLILWANIPAEKRDIDNINQLLDRLDSDRFLKLTPEEYCKKYPIETCRVLLHVGHENDIYTKVPRIGLKKFLGKTMVI